MRGRDDRRLREFDTGAKLIRWGENESIRKKKIKKKRNNSKSACNLQTRHVGKTLGIKKKERTLKKMPGDWLMDDLTPEKPAGKLHRQKGMKREQNSW